MKTPNYLGAERHAFTELALLPKRLSFHSVCYTKDVLEAVGKLGSLENLRPMEFSLLRTAASYQNTGYLSKYKNHEEAGVKLVQKMLPSYNYEPEDIEKICEMVMATKLPQNPSTKSQEILCDANLDYFGREDFFVRNELLRLEEIKHGIKITPREWFEQRLEILEEHKYFTQSAKNLRQKKKEQNIQEIKILLGINDNL
jgi:predicted metal-dependent HD superfamily phosphohydrolase